MGERSAFLLSKPLLNIEPILREEGYSLILLLNSSVAIEAARLHQFVEKVASPLF